MAKLVCAITLAAALFGVAPTQAGPIFTNRASFLAAAPGAVTTNFEENGPGAFTSYPATYPGAGFTISGTNMFTVDPAFGVGYYNWGTGDVLDAEGSILTFTPAAGVTAFGFDFGNPNIARGTGVATINGTNYALSLQPNFNFFGIVDSAGVGPVVVNFNGGVGIVDNVSLVTSRAVPEPSTWTLMVLGIGMMAGIMRRKRQAVRLAHG